MNMLKLAGAAIVAFGLGAGAAQAQDYPTKPVTLIVPFAPGGSNDIMGRYLADELGKLWGQPVVVENRPGAGASIGAAYVSQAAADGYTMLIGSVTYTMNPAVQQNLPYDPRADLTPVAMLGATPLVVGIGASTEAQTFEEFLARAKEGGLFYAATGPGSVNQFAAELFNQNAGTDMEVVHYGGGSEAMTDLIGGHVDVYFGSITQMLPQIRSGQLRGVAVTSAERNEGLPDLPTLQEVGIANSVVEQWWGTFVPDGTPEDVVTKLNADINTVMESEGAREFLARDGGVPTPMTQGEFAEHVTGEMDKWSQVAQETGITAN